MSDGLVRAACEKLWSEHKSDCSGFVKAVGKALGVAIEGQANDIADALEADKHWTVLTDGKAAAEAAGRGEFVVAGLRGDKQKIKSENGHVVVVVAGDPNRGRYPFAYWGQLGGVGKKKETINWAWSLDDRDRVIYATRELI
jgi:hypothetical protein